MGKTVEPIVFFLSRQNVISYQVKLPNGDGVLFTPVKGYTTSDPEEIDFLSQQKAIGARRITDSEYRLWATKKFSELPTYDNDLISKDEIAEFLLSSPQEVLLKSILESAGYSKAVTGQNKPKRSPKGK